MNGRATLAGALTALAMLTLAACGPAATTAPEPAATPVAQKPPGKPPRHRRHQQTPRRQRQNPARPRNPRRNPSAAG